MPWRKVRHVMAGGAFALLAVSVLPFVTSSGAASTKAKHQILVGAILSETGAEAVDGQAVLAGINAFNASGLATVGNDKIVIKVENDQSDPTIGATDARLLLSDNIVAEIGPQFSGSIETVAPLMISANIPAVIATIVAFNNNYTEYPDLFYTDLAPSTVLPGLSVKWLEQAHVSHPVELSLDDPIDRLLAPASEKLGFAVSFFPATLTDFTPLITGFKASGYDGLDIGVIILSSTIEAREAQVQAGFNVPTLLAEGTCSRALLAKIKGHTNGIYCWEPPGNLPTSLLTNSKVIAAVEQYQAAYKKANKTQAIFQNQLSVGGYDAAYAIREAVQALLSAHKGVTPAGIRTELANQHFYDAGGAVVRTANDHVGYQAGDNYLVRSNASGVFKVVYRA